ncbi:MAG: class I SAM-dependent methyltransferase [Paracoccaceae bacterium]
MAQSAKLVIGPTNGGKSSFLKFIGAENVVMSRNLERSSDAAYVHYNFLHFKTRSKSGTNFREALSKEPVLQKVLNSCQISEAIFIVCPNSELLDRCAQRTKVEKDFGDNSAYASDFWEQAIRETNLFELYEAAFSFFDDLNIKITVRYNAASHPDFPVSDRVFIADNLMGKYVEAPAEEEIEDLLEFEGVRYQTVKLPLGYDTNKKAYKHVKDGRDASFEMFRAKDFRGRSVLDLGCALGDMLYKSERLGATRLVGVELRQDTFEAAQRIASLLRSKAEIINSDFMTTEICETFDDVYALNVIHHVSDFRGFLINAAKLAKDRLIVEYPGFRDPLFRKLSRLPSRLSKRPLVGVSHSDVDQTFVFSPPAIERIVSEAGDFRTEVLKSPIKGRHLSIFHRVT